MDFRILGPFEVLDDDGRQLDLGPPRVRALLAFLVLHANDVVAVDRLVEELWPGGAPETAAKVLHVYVSQLRKGLGDARALLATRSGGYVLALADEQLDLRRFERRLAGTDELAGRARREALVEALALWRGEPLQEFAYESFAQPEIARLRELRLLALEARVEADLELGRAGELVPELESLVAAHPLRERFREQLMLALYRAGRQADALAVYREAKRSLDEELGLEPGERLRELERAILRQEPSLVAPARSVPATPAARAILVVPPDTPEAAGPLELAHALAGSSDPVRELLLVKVVEPELLSAASRALAAVREGLAAGPPVRVAAFSSAAPGPDIARLAARQPTDLVLLSPNGDGPLGDVNRRVLEHAPCDGAILLAPPASGPVVVPFGGSEHDWAALELGAWTSRALGRELKLIGATDETAGVDASRLLADASLVLQLTAGILAEPVLAAPGREGVAAQAAGAGLLVVGLSERWRSEGLGEVREALARSPVAPTALVRRGIRPGGLAPEYTLSRFTWSIAQGTSR